MQGIRCVKLCDLTSSRTCWRRRPFEGRSRETGKLRAKVHRIAGELADLQWSWNRRLLISICSLPPGYEIRCANALD